MDEALWTGVDEYVNRLFLAPDAALQRALEDSSAHGLPSIAVSPSQGKLLHLLARAVGARRILEIGTLGGYSTIWLARALPEGGHLITLEYSPKHAEVARANLARAGLSGVVDVRLGKAADTLAELAAERAGPFDLIFIDADKESYADYLRLSLELSRVGTLIIADNVVRKGAVIDAASADPLVQGIRRFNEAVAAEPRLSATALQTVGSKGYDGLAFLLVTGAK